MRWINKRNRKNRKQGHAIVNKFLRRGWDKSLGRYVNCCYSDLQGEGKMTHLLLREQGYLCCYCMRTISYKNHTTIEHILPRKTKGDDYNTITHYLNAAGFMKRKVKWTEEPPLYRIKVPPYPHYCAYENLVASCDGSIYDLQNPDYQYPSKLHNSCNNFRKNEEIIPLFFLKRINKILIYERDGELSYDEKYRLTIKAINLEYDTLKLIRRAWAKVSEYYSVDDVKKAMTDEELRNEIIDDAGFNAFDGNLLQHSNLWYLLYDYRWFYTYFKRRKKIRMKS